MLERQLFPIFCTVATDNVGTARLLDFVVNVCPSPAAMAPVATDSGSVAHDAAADPVVLIYRTMAEQHVGDYSFFRVYSGAIESGMDLENARSGSTERLGQLYALNGRERETAASMAAGDLGALVKLRQTHTNDTLRKKGKDVVVAPIDFPAPRYRAAIRPVNEGEEDRLAQGLHQITAEDPSLIVMHEPHLSQVTLGGQGELHLRVCAVQAEGQGQRRGRIQPPEGSLPRNGNDRGAQILPAQEADGRRRPIRGYFRAD